MVQSIEDSSSNQSQSQSQSQSPNLNSAINYNDPYFLSHGDNSNSQLGQIIFNGANYVNWSRSIQLALGAKNKISFIEGTLSRPDEGSADLQKWIRNDYMVTGWILYSIEKSIAESFIFSPSARQLWLEIKERYGHSNAPQLYEFHKNLMTTVQNDASIADYYSKLKKIWDQLQILEPFPSCTCGAMSKCSCDLIKKLFEADELKKLIQFIVGLNKNYDQVKVNLLSMDPLPSVNKAYHMLSQIEKQNSLSMPSTQLGMSALMSVNAGSHYRGINTSTGSKRDFMASKRDKQDRFCEHCKMRGHFKDQCFRIIGYPDWFKKKSILFHQPWVLDLLELFLSLQAFSVLLLLTMKILCQFHKILLLMDLLIQNLCLHSISTLYKEFLKMMQNSQHTSSDVSLPSTSNINFAGPYN